MSNCIACWRKRKITSAPFIIGGDSLCGVHLQERYELMFVGKVDVGDPPTEDELEWVDDES